MLQNRKCRISVCMVSKTVSAPVTGEDPGRATRNHILGRPACLILCLQSLYVNPKDANMRRIWFRGAMSAS